MAIGGYRKRDQCRSEEPTFSYYKLYYCDRANAAIKLDTIFSLQHFQFQVLLLAALPVAHPVEIP